MNSCILMAEIIQAPQLRYTSDNQTPIAEMLVQFPGLRDEDPPATLKVVGWGNLAQDIQEQYHEGDRVVIEGRLGMNTIDRPEGFKEKRAELTVQKIHRLDGATLTTHSDTAPATPQPGAKPPEPTKATGRSPAPSRSTVAEPSYAPTTHTAKSTTYTEPTQDYDNIPF
jgi:single-strand DNA-binding protein